MRFNDLCHKRLRLTRGPGESYSDAIVRRGKAFNKMLLRLSAGASPGCRALIGSLAGAEGNLGTIARLTLREEIVRGPRWADVTRAAHAIRTLAAASSAAATDSAWRTGCAPPVA